MSFLAILVGVAILWYIRNLSERLTAVERRLAGGVSLQPAAARAVSGTAASAGTPQAPLSQTQPALPVHGVDTAISSITPAQWVGGVGVLALLFGFAFFFKFAIDQGWISEWGRLGIGVIVGVLFLVLAELWHGKHARYAELLCAGGIGVLYFTVFAAYSFYNKVDSSVGLLCLIVITVSTLLLATRYSSRVLGMLGLAGAYVSPFLVDFARADHVAFFAYVTLVNVGLVALLWFDFWTGLLFAGLVGSILNFVAHGWGIPSGQTVAIAATFLMVNYALVCVGVPLLYRRAREHVGRQEGAFLGLFYVLTSLSVFTGIAVTLSGAYHMYIAPLMLLASVVTFLSYAVLDRLEDSSVNYSLVLIGTKFLVAAVLWQFTGAVENWYLLVVAAILFVAGLGLSRKELWVFGVLVSLLTGVKSIGLEVGMVPYPFFTNARFWVEMAVTVELALFGYALHRTKLSPQDIRVPEVLFSVAAAVLWFAGSQEVVGRYAGSDMVNARNLLLSLWWMVYASVLMVVGGLPLLRMIRRVATVLFGLTVLKVFLYDVRALDLEFRVVSFIVLGIILLVVAFYYQRHKDAVGRFLTGADAASEEGVS